MCGSASCFTSNTSEPTCIVIDPSDHWTSRAFDSFGRASHELPSPFPSLNRHRTLDAILLVSSRARSSANFLASSSKLANGVGSRMRWRFGGFMYTRRARAAGRGSLGKDGLSVSLGTLDLSCPTCESCIAWSGASSTGPRSRRPVSLFNITFCPLCLPPWRAPSSSSLSESPKTSLCVASAISTSPLPPPLPDSLRGASSLESLSLLRSDKCVKRDILQRQKRPIIKWRPITARCTVLYTMLAHLSPVWPAAAG